MSRWNEVEAIDRPVFSDEFASRLVMSVSNRSPKTLPRKI